MPRDSIISGGKKIICNAGVETMQEYLDRDKIKKKSPKVNLLVSPFATPFIPLEIVSQDMGGIIQSCTWMKSRSNAGGSVQVILAGDNDSITGMGLVISKPLEALWKSLGPDLRDIFKPMTLCQMWRDGYHVMAGYVRECRRQAQAGGAPTYSITIDELGTLYQQNILLLGTIWFGNYRDIFRKLDTFLEVANKQVGYPLRNHCQPLSRHLCPLQGDFRRNSLML